MSSHDKFSAGTEKGRVMCVGLACVDFVNVVGNFPEEDSDQRGEKYYWQRGGNAANNCTVLTKLCTPCDFMGVLGTKGAEASWIEEDFQSCGVSTAHCVRKDVQCSIATVILNLQSGTRTIVYFPRDQPQLTFEEFDKFKGDFSSYSWIHFELTSNVSDVCKMIASVYASQAEEHQGPCPGTAKLSSMSTDHKGSASCESSWRSDQQILVSVEVEKAELNGAERAMSETDVVFISKDFAKSRGCSDAVCAVKEFNPLCKSGAITICAWGESGAAACYRDGESQCVITVPALTNIAVVDSLGAGDSFTAGVIHTLVKRQFRPRLKVEHLSNWRERQKQVVEEALAFGCRVAGIKCTMFGYHGIRDLVLQ